jgi:hypothetical protein
MDRTFSADEEDKAVEATRWS